MTGEQIILGKTTLSIAGPGFDNSFPIFHHCSGEYMQSTNYTSTFNPVYALNSPTSFRRCVTLKEGAYEPQQWASPCPPEVVIHLNKVLTSPNNGLQIICHQHTWLKTGQSLSTMLGSKYWK